MFYVVNSCFAVFTSFEGRWYKYFKEIFGDLPSPKTYETVCEAVVVFNLPLIQANKALLCFADFLI